MHHKARYKSVIFRWELREWLRHQRGVTTAAEVSRIILERTRYKISIQAICDLFNDEPKMLRVETVKAFCEAFYCRLSDFCEIMPATADHARVNRTRHISALKSQKAVLQQTLTGSQGK